MDKDFIEARLIGVYDILESSNSIVMERLNKDERQLKRMTKTKFIAYLKTRHSDFKPEEITQAKTQAQRDKVIRKYENDYKQWKKEVHRQFAKEFAIEVGVFTLLDILF